MSQKSRTLKNVIAFVAIANLLYFFVEFLSAINGGSVSLFADSIDFLEDGLINILILLALNWHSNKRVIIGRFLAAFMLIPSLATLWSLFMKISSQSIPQSDILYKVGAGAFLVNLICAISLSVYRNHSSSLVKAAFLSSRNDLLANIMIICAGFVTTFYVSFIPDYIVGVLIAILNFNGAKEVWSAANNEKADLRS